jgi:hypothetical protein
VAKLADAKPPVQDRGIFEPIKVAGIALLFCLVILAISYFFKPDDLQIWITLIGTILGYMFGYGTAKASKPER